MQASHLRQGLLTELSADAWDYCSAASNRPKTSDSASEIWHDCDIDDVRDALWTSFKDVSGWVLAPSCTRRLYKGADFSNGGGNNAGYYRSTDDPAEFATPRGGTNPLEDFAAVWELYFASGRATHVSNPQLTAKLKLVDRLVRMCQ